MDFESNLSVSLLGASPFRPTLLRPQGLTLVGSNGPNFADDLPERICAAYYALRQAEVYDTRGKTAQALNRHGLRTQARGSVSTRWESAQVYERVKQLESRFKKSHAGTLTKTEMKEWRYALAQKWLFLSCPAPGSTVYTVSPSSRMKNSFWSALCCTQRRSVNH